jgi:pimeloyl-ACP methyl ester carboxylesterase
MRALLVHGAGGGAWEWEAWVPALVARGIEPLAIELAPAAGGLERTRYEDYLAQVIEAGEGCRALIGASLGGLLVLEAAACLAARALVLVNPLPPSPWHRLLPPRLFPPRIPWSLSATEEGTRRAMPDADEATVRSAARRWRDESGAVLAAAWAGRTVSRLAIPVLLLVSEADDELPTEALRACAEGLGAETWTIPAAGHLSPLLGRDAMRLAGAAADWLAPRLAAVTS